ncbi:6010_t:CDS:1 [Diversispora eburnea]|uniref:6010_t:CDS:1 n=1 Tax=Diversispora eburnea TaxID=1213867 RepID=A0A9N8VBK0_9GLOM|nr:6010_t:CDS:1 [Diversispora eburnea]
MSIHSLPTECLKYILENLKNHTKTLHCCLLVNRFWCKNVIKLLWSHPFSLIEAGKPNVGNSLISTYVLFLKDEEIALLLNRSIDIFNNNPPLFNYPSFLNELNCSTLTSAILNWLFAKKLPMDWNEVSLLVKSLCELFMRSCTNFYSLKISLPSFDFVWDYLDFFNIFNVQPGLSNLTKFQLVIVGECNIREISNLTKFLTSLPKICTGVKELYIECMGEQECFIELIANIIRSQHNLLKIRIKCTREDSVNYIMPALQHQQNSLNSVQLHLMNLDRISLDHLAACHNLTSLELNGCYGLTLNNIIPLMNANFAIKNLYLWNPLRLTNVHSAIIQKAGQKLRKLVLSQLTREITQTILTFCPNITHLEIGYSDKISTFFISLLNNLQITHLTIQELNSFSSNLDLIKMLPSLGENLPYSLNYLKLDGNFDPNQVDNLVINCKSPIKTLICKNIRNIPNKSIIHFIKSNEGSLKRIGVMIKQIYLFNFKWNCFEKRIENDEYKTYMYSSLQLDDSWIF